MRRDGQVDEAQVILDGLRACRRRSRHELAERVCEIEAARRQLRLLDRPRWRGKREFYGERRRRLRRLDTMYDAAFQRWALARVADVEETSDE